MKKNEIKSLSRNYSMVKRIMLVFLFLYISLITFAQDNRITLNIENASLSEVFKELKNQSGINILFNNNLVEEYKNETVNINNATLEQALQKVLQGKKLQYKIVDDVIIIEPKIVTSEQNTIKPPKITQTIRGTIIDKDSKVTLPGANVVIVNSSPLIGTVSETDGTFKLKDVPIGRHTIQVSFIGYEDTKVPEILLGSAKEVIINIQLVESISKLDEVVVRPDTKGSPNNQMATVSARSFSVEESKRYAASISDPGRMALSFAGVNSDDDATNQIVIRGNSPTGMLWQIEGVQIPTPNHFMMEGVDPGAISILSTNMIGQSDFFTGAFPAEYGNASSGVFDISLRNGNNDKHENTFQFGVMGADISMEGPFSKNYKGSYLFNYRYSTFNMLNLIGVRIDGDILPKYSDLAFKVNLPTKKTGTFSIWGLGGKGYMERIPIKDSATWNSIYNTYGYETTTYMGATGLTHTFFPDKKSFFKTTVAFTGNSHIDNGFQIDSSYVRNENYEDILSSSAIRYSLLYNRKMGSRITLKTGVIYSDLFYNFVSNFNDSTNTWKEILDDKGKTETYQAFIQTKIKLSNNLSFNIGAHYLQLGLNNKSSLDPRAGLLWSFKNNQSIGIGVGMHSKHEALPVYFDKDSINGELVYYNKNLDLQQSFHYVISYSKMIKNDLMFKAEIYYQDLSKIPVSKDSTKAYSSINDVYGGFDAVSKGIGRNYGLELTLEKFFTNDMYYLATASIFDSKYKPLDGKWYNTRYNTNFIFNFTGGKEWDVQENNLLGINAKFIFGGGKRDTPYDTDKMLAQGDDINDYYFLEDQRWEKQYRPYLRLDVGCSYKIYKENKSHTISLDIQNTTNMNNIGGAYWDLSENKEIEYTMQGILPVLNYRLEF